MRRVILIVAFISVLVLSGCGITNPRPVDSENERFYQGSEGVYMRFIPGSPPPRLFYHASGGDNTFDIAVELHNMGASAAVGGLYISGYSPDLIDVQGTDIHATGLSNCIFDVNNIGFGGDTPFNFFFSCIGENGAIDTGVSSSGDVDVRFRNIAQNLGLPLENVGFSTSGGMVSFDMGWDNFGSIDVFNRGKALSLVLSSVDFNRNNGYPFNDIGSMKGDNHEYPGGEFGFQTFSATVGNDWPAGLDEADVTFLVTSCYGYATYAAPKVCIDPSPYDESEKVCYPQEYTWSGSQGAPVAITNLKQDPAGDSIYFTFSIRNVGRGRIFNLGYLERCSPYFEGRLDSRALDVVYIGDIRVGNHPLVCTPGHQIRLVDGIGTFTCKYDMVYGSTKTAYETPIVVELWYGYQETIRTTTRIKRVV